LAEMGPEDTDKAAGVGLSWFWQVEGSAWTTGAQQIAGEDWCLRERQ